MPPIRINDKHMKNRVIGCMSLDSVAEFITLFDRQSKSGPTRYHLCGFSTRVFPGSSSLVGGRTIDCNEVRTHPDLLAGAWMVAARSRRGRVAEASLLSQNH